MTKENICAKINQSHVHESENDYKITQNPPIWI